MSKNYKILDMIVDILERFLTDFIEVIAYISPIPYDAFHDKLTHYIDNPIRIYYIEQIYYG